MFPIGLAAVNEGYDQGALNYWKRREAEDTNAGQQALASGVMRLMGGIPSGPPPMAMPSPMGMPQAPGGPPGGGGVPWPGDPSGGGMPPSRMGAGASAEAAAVNAGTWQPAPDYGAGVEIGAQVGANPPPGGATMGGAPGASLGQIPGMSSGPPGGLPGMPPGGPPQMPGQGGPGLPPGGPGMLPGGATMPGRAPGMPPGGPMAGPRPGMMPPGGPGGPGGSGGPGGPGGPQQGGMPQRRVPDWAQLGQAILAGNPNIKPSVFFKAMEQGLGMFSKESQLEYRIATIGERERLLAIREAGLDRRQGVSEAGKDTRQQISEEGKGGRQQISEEGKGSRQQIGITAAGERQKTGIAATGERQDKAIAAADARQTERLGAAGERQTERLTAMERRQANSLALRNPEVRALTSALTQTEKQKAAVDSFADTELANLKVLLTLADKVDSTGIPVIERWLRAGKKATGDKDVAAFDFQLGITRPGIARIVSSPNMTGSLTNQARSEINAGMGEGISAEQLHWIYPLIERDINTRKQSIDTQVDRIQSELRSRLGGGIPGAAPPGAASGAAAPGARVPGAAPDDGWTIKERPGGAGGPPGQSQFPGP